MSTYICVTSGDNTMVASPARKLEYPAPRREWYLTRTGWCSRPWTLKGVTEVLEYGGWFKKGRGVTFNQYHDFESALVERVATQH